MLPLTPLPVLWTALSCVQKEQGIHPNQLKNLKFDCSESTLSASQLQIFFLGCRAAMSKEDYLSITVTLLNRDERLPKLIRTVVADVLFAQMPKEIPPIKVESDKYNFTLALQDIEIFAEVYNQLANANKCHLMHPARHSELIAYLNTEFSDTERAADRLIRYRCLGTDAVNVCVHGGGELLRQVAL